MTSDKPKPKKSAKQVMKEVNQKMAEVEVRDKLDKFDKLIEKQKQREREMKQAREDFINEVETPKKQITVKLFPNTHKTLKVIATAKDTTLETIATSILEDRIEGLDIVEFVSEAFKSGNDGFDWLQRIDIDNSAYDVNDKLLNKGNPRKRINVKVNPETHKKLRVVSAIQERSLDQIVGSIIEYEVGEENNIDTVKLMNEILESIDKE
jgi:predicted HicB family RNase H-like nuclease